MAKDDKEIVSALHAKLADRVGEQRYELWFGNGTEMGYRDGQLALTAPSRFVRDWLRQHFRADLEAACRDVLGELPTIEYHINPELAKADQPAAAKPRRKATEPSGTLGAAAGQPAAAQPATLPLHAATASTATAAMSGAAAQNASMMAAARTPGFDDFIVGAGNKLAHTTAQLIIERPGSISPLVVHGPTGCGKTHLLQAIRSAAVARNQKLHAVYLTAEQFTTYFLEALGGKGLPNFRRKYRGVDLLIIDDVQFFAGKRATLVEMLYTIDTLLQQGKQLVFSSDRAPNELSGLGPELAARLTGGLVCRVEQPDFETRRGIVDVLCRRMGIDVPADVQTLVATHVTSHARELSGALNRLQATSLATEKPITMQLAEEALAELAVQTSRIVRLPDIQRAVCDVFGLEPDSLQSNRKAKAISYPRMLAMFLARKYTRAALSEIGYFFGRRSHSTVISANKKVAGWMSQRQPLNLAEQTWDIEEALRRVEEQLRAG